MSVSVTTSSERFMLYAQVGFRVVDDFTTGDPIGWVRYSLDLWSNGTWQPSGRQPVFTASGIVAYPELGRVSDPDRVGPLNGRLQIEAEFYRPAYRSLHPGVQFTVHPYNHTRPPKQTPTGPTTVILLPASNYPYPTHVPVIRGLVVRAGSGAPVADAHVSVPNRTGLTLTDERGAFALPLPRTKPQQREVIVAGDDRRNTQGIAGVKLPDDLGTTITIRI